MAKWIEEPEGSRRWRQNLYVNGRPHKLTSWGSKKDALAFEARKRIELGAAPVSHGTAPDYETFCVETYKPAAKARLRASTWSVRKYQLERLILHFGRLKLTRINEGHIETYKTKRRGEGADIQTVNTELNVLSATLRYARDVLRLPCSNPRITRFKLTKTKKARVRFYTRAEVGWIFRACHENAPHFLPLITFIFETGARKSEAINLRWSNVMLDQRIVRIWSDVEPGDDEGEKYQVKSREREVTISDHLARVLAEQKLRGASREFVFPVVMDREKTKGEKYHEFPNNTWDRVLRHATKLARGFAKQAALNAGAADGEADDAAKKVRPIIGGPHRARHTYASHFLQVKPDLFLLARCLGHGHTRVTELYSHLLPEHLAEARNVVTFGAEALNAATGAQDPSPAKTPTQVAG